MYWRLCVVGTMSISLSSFFPVEVSGRIAIVLTGTSPVRAADLGRARERCNELLPALRAIAASPPGRRSAAPGPCRSRSAATSDHLAGGGGSERCIRTRKAPTPERGDERERAVDDREARAVGGAAGAIGARGAFGLADRLGRLGLDESRPVVAGRVVASLTSGFPRARQGRAAAGLARSRPRTRAGATRLRRRGRVRES